MPISKHYPYKDFFMLFKNYNFSKIMFLALVIFISACKNDQKSKGVINLVSELEGSETDLKAPSSDNVEGGKAILTINKITSFITFTYLQYLPNSRSASFFPNS